MSVGTSFYAALWALLVRFFKVPDRPPRMALGPGEQCQQFRPAPGFLKVLRIPFWLAVFVSVLLSVPLLLLALMLEPLYVLLLLPVLFLLVAPPALLLWVAAQLRYDSTWYVMGERSLTLRRGIWTIHEMTVTFENVQNLKIVQGPVERYFGISKLLIETAGGAPVDPKTGLAPARPLLEGIEQPERLRATILGKLRQSQNTGLGDEPEHEEQSSAFRAEHLQRLREIRDELRALRMPRNSVRAELPQSVPTAAMR
ncbi:MAG: PH domain-containing protein [Myxococcota bacterium]|jgi:membrane protein YdbS with pleckstrin-like domain|nr:PH domain-containing protein [Myxococcota bacterium]